MGLAATNTLKTDASNTWFNEKNLVRGACLVIALLVIADLAVLFRGEIGTFFTTHREFSTLLLPIGLGAFAFTAGISQVKKREQLIGALVLVSLTAFLVCDLVFGYSAVKQPALAAFVGVCGYFVLFSRQPYKERPDEITTNCGFEREVTWSYEKNAWQEVTWKAWESKLTICQKEWEKMPTVDGQVFKYRNVFFRYRLKKSEKGTGNSQALYCDNEKRCIAAMHQRRGDIVPLYPLHSPWHDWGCALAGSIVLPLKAIAGIIYNGLRIPMLILYLAVRFPYDLWHSKERLALLGKRFTQMNKVVGDSLRNCLNNLYYGSATTLCCLAVVFGEGAVLNRPMNLKMRIAELEQEWNGVPLGDAYWSIVGAQDNFRFEGGLLPEKTWKPEEWYQKWEELTDNLNNHGLYILGCFQPLYYGRLNAKNAIESVHEFGASNDAWKPLKVAPYDLFAADPEDRATLYPPL